ncbi:hypothetical protein TWF481_000519 [Arthrobotrys musiformis]|uniref:C2H2-type domain-containing protein n=1 Tax=Arthrobotrys musiformis TaxID=47236 RepID=A0AAV9WMU6_9PEZI
MPNGKNKTSFKRDRPVTRASSRTGNSGFTSKNPVKKGKLAIGALVEKVGGFYKAKKEDRAHRKADKAEKKSWKAAKKLKKDEIKSRANFISPSLKPRRGSSEGYSMGPYMEELTEEIILPEAKPALLEPAKKYIGIEAYKAHEVSYKFSRDASQQESSRYDADYSCEDRFCFELEAPIEIGLPGEKNFEPASNVDADLKPASGRPCVRKNASPEAETFKPSTVHIKDEFDKEQSIDDPEPEGIFNHHGQGTLTHQQNPQYISPTTHDPFFQQATASEARLSIPHCIVTAIPFYRQFIPSQTMSYRLDQLENRCNKQVEAFVGDDPSQWVIDPSKFGDRLRCPFAVFEVEDWAMNCLLVNSGNLNGIKHHIQVRHQSYSLEVTLCNTWDQILGVCFPDTKPLGSDPSPCRSKTWILLTDSYLAHFDFFLVRESFRRYWSLRFKSENQSLKRPNIDHQTGFDNAISSSPNARQRYNPLPSTDYGTSEQRNGRDRHIRDIPEEFSSYQALFHIRLSLYIESGYLQQSDKVDDEPDTVKLEEIDNELDSETDEESEHGDDESEETEDDNGDHHSNRDDDETDYDGGYRDDSGHDQDAGYDRSGDNDGSGDDSYGGGEDQGYGGEDQNGGGGNQSGDRAGGDGEGQSEGGDSEDGSDEDESEGKLTAKDKKKSKKKKKQEAGNRRPSCTRPRTRRYIGKRVRDQIFCGRVGCPLQRIGIPEHLYDAEGKKNLCPRKGRGRRFKGALSLRHLRQHMKSHDDIFTKDQLKQISSAQATTWDDIFDILFPSWRNSGLPRPSPSFDPDHPEKDTMYQTSMHDPNLLERLYNIVANDTAWQRPPIRYQVPDPDPGWSPTQTAQTVTSPGQHMHPELYQNQNSVGAPGLVNQTQHGFSGAPNQDVNNQGADAPHQFQHSYRAPDHRPLLVYEPTQYSLQPSRDRISPPSYQARGQHGYRPRHDVNSNLRTTNDANLNFGYPSPVDSQTEPKFRELEAVPPRYLQGQIPGDGSHNLGGGTTNDAIDPSDLGAPYDPGLSYMGNDTSWLGQPPNPEYAPNRGSANGISYTLGPSMFDFEWELFNGSIPPDLSIGEAGHFVDYHGIYMNGPPTGYQGPPGGRGLS